MGGSLVFTDIMVLYFVIVFSINFISKFYFQFSLSFENVYAHFNLIFVVWKVFHFIWVLISFVMFSATRFMTFTTGFTVQMLCYRDMLDSVNILTKWWYVFYLFVSHLVFIFILLRLVTRYIILTQLWSNIVNVANFVKAQQSEHCTQHCLRA